MKNTYIILESCCVSPARIINKAFENIPTALQYMMDNTGLLDNGQRFFISDFNTGESKRYCGYLTMVIQNT